MKHFQYLLLLFLIASGCKNKPAVQLKGEIKPNQVVLIFNNPVKNGFYKLSDGTSTGRTNAGDEIQYIDDQFIQRRLTIDFEREWDTVVLHSKREWVEVMLMYKGTDDLSYIFKNGDTAVFNYDGIKPIGRIANREEYQKTTNFSLYLRDSVASEEYMAMDYMSFPLRLAHKYKKGKNEDYGALWGRIKDLGAKNISNEVEKELLTLNKLIEEKLINQVQYNIRLHSLHSKLYMQKASLNLQKENGSLNLVNQLLSKVESISPNIKVQNDSLLYIIDRARSLAVNVSSVYSKGIRMIKQQTKGGGGSSRDYRQLYDSIRVSSQLTQNEKKVLQYGNINALLSQHTFFNIESRLKYLTRFRNDFNDTVLVNELMTKYNMKFQIDNEISLESIDGKTSTLETLLSEHHGKVVYVDYWASWCAPCIAEMPSSKALQTNFDPSEVVFVYLSTDRRKENWLRAIEKHKLDVGHHFRITNVNTSKGLENLNIPFIPRYMIYDTKGELTNNDAPRPSESALLTKEFNKYLKLKN